jgi:hypothetical protein
MAGGSLPAALTITHEQFLKEAVNMRPLRKEQTLSQWILSHPQKKGFIVYNKSTHPIQLDLKDSKDLFYVRWIDPVNGEMIKEEKRIPGGRVEAFKNPKQGDMVLWLSSE